MKYVHKHDDEDILTTAQIAVLLLSTVRQIRENCRSGAYGAKKIGGKWAIRYGNIKGSVALMQTVKSAVMFGAGRKEDATTILGAEVGFKDGKPPSNGGEDFPQWLEKTYPHAAGNPRLTKEDWKRAHPDVDYGLSVDHSMEAHTFLSLAGKFMAGGLVTIEEVEQAAKRVQHEADKAIHSSEFINGKLGYCDTETRQSVVAKKLAKNQDDRRKERGIPTPPPFQAKDKPKKSPLYDQVMKHIQSTHWFQFPYVCSYSPNHAVITTHGKSWQANLNKGIYYLRGMGDWDRWWEIGNAKDLQHCIQGLRAARMLYLSSNHKESPPTRKSARSVSVDVNTVLYERFVRGKGKQPKMYARLPHKFLLDRFQKELRISFDGNNPKITIGHIDPDGTWRLDAGWKDAAATIALEWGLKVPASELEEVPF